MALKRRVRCQIASADVVCPHCSSTMDSFGDHAEVCRAKGDIVLRHNAVQRVIHEECRAGGPEADMEKAGLLPARPVEDGATLLEDELEDVARLPERDLPGGDERRRPADVWLPRGAGGAALGRPRPWI